MELIVSLVGIIFISVLFDIRKELSKANKLKEEELEVRKKLHQFSKL
jgi:hypothetical protein